MSPTGQRARRPEQWLERRGGWVELLRLPAGLFGLATGLRNWLYDVGVLRAERADVPVISVGNLTAGGTGKTPCVQFLVAELRERGWRPGLLSRGYRRSEGADGANDEARMLARRLTDVPHVQDPDRVTGARALVARGADVLLLDDGFQHRRLARDLDLVLVDATRPYGLPSGPNGEPAPRALLPRGLLREGLGALRRAHAVLLTRTDQVAPERVDALAEELSDWAPGVPMLRAAHRPVRLREVHGSSHPSALRGREVDLVSGIGNPEAFEKTVRDLGARVGEHRRFPDHHAYREGDLAGLGENGAVLVTTEKDAVKLESLRPDLCVLEVAFALESGAPVLAALLDALVPGQGRVERERLHEGLHG